MRDMLVALGVLVILVIGFGAGWGSWSFAPTGPSVDPGAGPSVDAGAELNRLAPTVPFPVRNPAKPSSWRVNSVNETSIDGGQVVHVGFVTPAGRYLQLLQSDSTEETLLASVADGPVPGRGPVDVDGHHWLVYAPEGTPEARAEPFWTTEVTTPGAAPVRMLVSGSGTDEDFRVLAAAAVQSTPVPR
jgi:hypothetical protein